MTSSVAGLYRSVIEDVINNVREAFLDEGVDEQVLQELKQVWDNKLLLSKAVPVEGAQSSSDHHQHQHQQAHALQPQFALQTQGHGATNTKRGSAAIAQHLPSGAVVQPTVQYQYTTGELGEASKTVTITLPQGVGGSQKPVAIALPAIMQQAAAGIVMSSSATAAATALPSNIAAGILQPSLANLNSGNVFSHQNADGTTVHYQAVTAEQLAKQGYTINVTQANQQPSQQVHLNSGGMIQLDGVNDTSDDDDDDDDFKDDDNDIDNDDEVNDEENDAGGEEEEPLNSEDDVSDEDPSELFDTDNVIVCQYDKITRSRNKWKFHLKDGIMNLQGKDFVFQRASGDAEW